MDLTQDELELIQKRRAAQADAEAQRVFKSKAIATAAAFEIWSQESDLGLTFSTFVETFNYQDSDARAMFEALQRIQNAAWPEAKGK